MDNKRIRSITTKIPSPITRTITTAVVAGILVLGVAFLPPAQYVSAQQPGQEQGEPGQPGQPGSGGGEPGQPGQPGQPGSGGGEPGEGATTEGATTEGATTEGATTEGATTTVCIYGSTGEITEAQIRILEILGIPFELGPCQAE
jgi:hypothetical protein